MAVALRDQWLAQRHHRQSEVAQRRVIVQNQLTEWQQARETDKIALHQELAEFHAALQAETQLFLAQVHQQHQTRAQRTWSELAAFHQTLQASVAHLRDRLQGELVTLQGEVQAQLAAHNRDRIAMGQAQAATLEAYVADLQDQVATYLAQVASDRQTAAVQDQAQRHRDRAALTQDVEAMFADLAIFRQQLTTFRQQLHRAVWGDGGLAVESIPAPAPVAVAVAAAPAPAPTAAPEPAPSQPPSPIPSQNGKSAKAQEETPIEERVFGYLQDHHDGARLTEIESNLGINRFQAVDALRSLIQKELIVQRDRIYHVQEEALL